jgi:putative MATE family efflux protein
MTQNQKHARYLEGSVWRHIVRMTLSGGLGLLALFAVDLIDLFFISLIGEQELAAAVGFAGSLMFFTQSLSIGLSIAVGATVSKAFGSEDMNKAAELVTSGLMIVFLSSVVITLIVWIFRATFLSWLGADGETLAFAVNYLGIILPAFPFLAVGMSAGGVMRAQGDASGALWLTLSGAIVNAILDPILIFGLGLGLPGAAIASVFSRLTMFAFGIYKVGVEYKLIQKPNIAIIKREMPELTGIAIPSVLTNLATPIGIAFVTASMAQFGDAAVAGNAIISRLQMVAFVGLYALSSVVGPIAGQNWGAQKFGRVNSVLTDSMKFVVVYCIVVCAGLAALTDVILYVFQASPESAELIRWFNYGLSLMFVFNGMTFVTNALFNNLGAPKISTVFNVSKATVFTIPFVWVGAQLGGAPGILVGQALGAVIVALAGWYWCRKLIGTLGEIR